MRLQDRGNGDEEKDHVRSLLKRAVAPVGADAERDLWPAMQQRLKERSDVALRIRGVPWFDWALAGAVAISVLAFPGMIPVLLYYL